MKAHRNLIKYALAAGNTVSVHDGGDELALVKSSKHNEIIEAIEAVELAEVMIYNPEGKRLGWALVLPYEDAEDTVSDHTDNEYMNNWWNQK